MRIREYWVGHWLIVQDSLMMVECKILLKATEGMICNLRIIAIRQRISW